MVSTHRKRLEQQLGLNRSDRIRLWLFAGGFVLVLGIFLGLRLMASGAGNGDPAGGEENRPDRALGSGTKLPVTKLDPAWGQEVLEGSFAERTATDERPYWLVLNYVRHLGIEGYREIRGTEGYEISLFEDSVRRLTSIPESFRFAFVSVPGTLRDLRTEPDPPENSGKIDRVHSAVLELSSGELVRLVSPIPWAQHGAEAGAIRVEGVFYKRWAYRKPSGEEREIPLVVVAGMLPPNGTTGGGSGDDEDR